jgi:hypothetical protein
MATVGTVEYLLHVAKYARISLQPAVPMTLVASTLLLGVDQHVGEGDRGEEQQTSE